MSTDEQATLGDYNTPEPNAEAASPQDDEPAQRAAWARDEDAGDGRDLAAIFEHVAGVTTVTETQEETPSHSPVEGDANDVPDLTDDGLEDAAASDYSGGLW